MTPHPNRFLISCITILSLANAGLGAWLEYKGFGSGGGILIGAAGTGLGGLLGLAQGRGSTQVTAEPPSNITVNPPTS